MRLMFFGGYIAFCCCVLLLLQTGGVSPTALLQKTGLTKSATDWGPWVFAGACETVWIRVDRTGILKIIKLLNRQMTQVLWWLTVNKTAVCKLRVVLENTDNTVPHFDQDVRTKTDRALESCMKLIMGHFEKSY